MNQLVTVDPSAATPTDVATTTAAAEATEATETATASATTSDAAPAAPTPAPASGGIDLGSCTDPTIKFGAGIENRKETSFIPNNTKEFAHGSAQNSAIITQFICDVSVPPVSPQPIAKI
jgi:hypothetical protein